MLHHCRMGGWVFAECRASQAKQAANERGKQSPIAVRMFGFMTGNVHCTVLHYLHSKRHHTASYCNILHYPASKAASYCIILHHTAFYTASYCIVPHLHMIHIDSCHDLVVCVSCQTRPSTHGGASERRALLLALKGFCLRQSIGQ